MKRALSTQERQTLLKVIKDDPVAWGETYFYVEDPCDIETGDLLPPGPIRLFPHQQRIIRAALQRRRDGSFRWKTIIYSAPKKSGKTRCAAMMAAWLAATQGPYAEVYLIANDGKQSNDRLLKAVEKAVTLSPLLDWRVRRGRIELEDQSFLEAIPVDPKGESGANPVCTCWSELWGFGSAIQNKERLWSEMTASPVRRGKSIRIVESYAGYVGESQVLEGLYENTVRQGKKHPSFPNLPVYINDAGGIFCYWDHVPRMPWQTKDYYRHEAAVLTTNEFERLHRNKWVSSTEDYIDEILWNKCQEQIAPAHPHEAWIIALDGSVNHDSFAIVGVTRHPERRGDIAIRFVHVIEPDRGRKIDQEVEVVPILERLCDEHYVVSIPYDPYQLHKLATDLERDGMAHFSEFSQGGKRLTADSQLRRMIISRQIAHQGHPVLTEHIAHNAAAKVDGTEHQVRIVKKSDSMRVDAAVALSMAVAECLRLNLE